jgi:hypothetical protein
MFHLAWMLLVVVLLAVLMRQHWRQVLFAAAAPLLVVVFWYAKNYYYFGAFGASTAMGLGLSNITTLLVEREQLLPLAQQGRLSPYALVSRYERPDLLFKSQAPVQTGVPVLDQVKKSDGRHYNYNNQHLVGVNRHFTRDAIEVARTFPASYVIGLILSNYLFFSPSNMNSYFSDANREAVAPMERIFNPLLYGVGTKPGLVEQPHFGFTGSYRMHAHPSLPLIALWCVLMPYAYLQARRGVMTAEPESSPRALTLGFIMLTALYLYAVATAIELSENFRYRFNIEPLFMVLTATAATDLIRRLRARFAKLRLQ